MRACSSQRGLWDMLPASPNLSGFVLEEGLDFSVPRGQSWKIHGLRIQLHVWKRFLTTRPSDTESGFDAPIGVNRSLG